MHETYRKAGVKPGDELEHKDAGHTGWIVASESLWRKTRQSGWPHSTHHYLDKGMIPVVHPEQNCRGGINIATRLADWAIVGSMEKGPVCEPAESPFEKDVCPHCNSKNTGWVSLVLKCRDCGYQIC